MDNLFRLIFSGGQPVPIYYDCWMRKIGSGEALLYLLWYFYTEDNKKHPAPCYGSRMFWCAEKFMGKYFYGRYFCTQIFFGISIKRCMPFGKYRCGPKIDTVPKNRIVNVWDYWDRTLSDYYELNVTMQSIGGRQCMCFQNGRNNSIRWIY